MAFTDNYGGTVSTASTPSGYFMALCYRPVERAAHYVLSGIASVLFALGFAAWRFVDIPAHVVAAIDDMAQQFAAGISTKATAFRAFAVRALTHPAYIAGHFDPGRLPA